MGMEQRVSCRNECGERKRIMIRVNQIHLKPDHDIKELQAAVYKALRLSGKDTCRITISKRSIDARHKPNVMYIYSVNVTDIRLAGKKQIQEEVFVKKLKNRNVSVVDEKCYEFPVEKIVIQKEEDRPVIIGFGPAGMFAALKLAEAGLRPVVYERGQSVEERKRTVESFWNGGSLNTESNVQFGEGGAGTFSDGKLNTMIKDPTGRIREVLRIFAEYGADSNILYVNKPHIGTDVLSDVVKNIRNKIISLGGEIHFNTRFEAFQLQDRHICGVKLHDNETGKDFVRSCKMVCLAVGHSARDTFQTVLKTGCLMQPKAFAVGVRMEHPQDFINYNAYGDCSYKLPAADYKVTYQTQAGKGVYSFCMCPGGYVVNASSEPERIAVNGMSYSGRSGNNANSAIIVTVTPEDFGGGILGGMEFQRQLEHLAYENGGGKIPVQLFGDFKNNRISTGFGAVTPCIKGAYAFADLNKVLPAFLTDSLKEGITGFAGQIKGFDMEEAVLSGVESRTSSPVRILRNEQLQSDSIGGLYPCGEGAGYAGGITSAAVDGIKVAERMYGVYKNNVTFAGK